MVAGEVRILAQRSAAAAKEINDLINDSVTKVKDGAELVNNSGKTLNEIVASVKKVSLPSNSVGLITKALCRKLDISTST